MKIIDIKEVENGYWKLTAEIEPGDSFFKERKNPKKIDVYYKNKETLINAVNAANRSGSSYDIALFADLVIDNKTSRVIKNRFGKTPAFSDLVFSYIQHNNT
jgi:hypothetical protein